MCVCQHDKTKTSDRNDLKLGAVVVFDTIKKGKASSLDIAPLTVMNSGTLQPRKWQLTGN